MQYSMRCFLLLLSLAVAATACGSPDDPGAGARADGDWVLDMLVIQGDMAIALPDDPIDLRIDGDTFDGSAGCNSMGGTATFDLDGSLQIGDAFMTEMACMDTSLMDFEQTYMQAITAADAWAIDDDRLTLTGTSLELVYVVRTAPPDLPIQGTTWTLDTFFDADAAMNAAGMDRVTVRFGNDRVTAAGPCWSIEGPATIEPGGEGNLRVDFSASDPSFSCDEREFFGDMMDRLGRINEYEIDESRLTLGQANDAVLGFRGQP